MVDGYLISISILAFFMSFSIGANDAANALATSYGSNALRLLWLVLLGSLFEFIGAYWCSGHVAGQLVGSVIDNVDTLDQKLVEKMMLGTSIASFIFIMLSSVFSMPISGTHTVVGGLIGSGLATVGSGDINWNKLGVIVASWFVAPILSIILCTLFFIAVCVFTLNKDRFEYKTRLLWLTVITAVAFFLIALMFVKLVTETGSDFSATAITFLVLSPILGIFITRLILLILTRPRSLNCCAGILISLKFWSASEYEELLEQRLAQAAVVDTGSESGDLLQEKEKNHAKVISEVYRYLMLMAAMMVCLGHGSNDVANSISPLLMVMQVDEKNIKDAYLLGSFGIALGLLALGYKVMETVGKSVVKLDFAKGFTAQFATALSVSGGSIIGLPLSTTHCMVGALMGLLLALKMSDSVKHVYPPEQEELESQRDSQVPQTDVSSPFEAPPTNQDNDDDYLVSPRGSVQTVDEARKARESADKNEGDAVKGKVIGKIIIWWLATVPVALIVSFAITKLIV